MSPKLKCHQNGNGNLHKYVWNRNRDLIRFIFLEEKNVTKTGMSPKVKCHQK